MKVDYHRCTATCRISYRRLCACFKFLLETQLPVASLATAYGKVIETGLEIKDLICP